MHAGANVTAYNKTGKTNGSRIGLARQMLADLHKTLGNWRAVAAHLKPHYGASAGLWWKVASGQSDNPAAVAAVLAACDVAQKRRCCWRPYCSADTRRLLDTLRHPGETDDALIRRLAGKEQGV